MGSPRRNPTRSSASDDLSNRILSSGAIQAGAHPEFEQPTPLEKIGGWINNHFGTKAPKATTPGSGSPTVTAKDHPVPRPLPPPMSKAVEDSLAKKYLGV